MDDVDGNSSKVMDDVYGRGGIYHIKDIVSMLLMVLGYP